MTNVIHALANQKHIRIMAIDATEMVHQAQIKHRLSPTATAALGRTMAIAALMAAQLKNDKEMISIRIAGDGPLGTIRVDANQNGHVVGFVGNPDVHYINPETHKLDVGKAVGQGSLSVSRNLGLKDEYTSTIDLVSGEIGEDFAMYFVQSEQLPSAVSVGVLVDQKGQVQSAGALLIQMMPNHDETDIKMAEHAIAGLKPISQIFNEGMSVAELVMALFDDLEIVAESSAKFQCHYTRDMMRDVVKSIGVDDLKEFIQQDQGLDLECHYCGDIFHFTTADLEAIYLEKTDAKN